jgi:hypothetical protein
MLLRIYTIEAHQLDQHASPDPQWARKMGYEPGTKRRRRGGLTDEPYEMFTSAYPNIDIRHANTYSPSKVLISSFKHPPNPETWKQHSINNIPGWDDIKGRFI